ncbi:hypothetical protein KAU30_01550 [Candidatus Bathyarchaeota archaeon]|nr:hypothetical protein [Candidatus Bathyarchaeota archaeon]
MFAKKILRISANNPVLSVFLITNTFVWLFGLSKILNEAMRISTFSSYVTTTVWGINFCGAVGSIFAGAFLRRYFDQRASAHFLLFWILFGTVSSIAPVFISTTTTDGILATSLLFSVSLGLGLPICMACFAECTVVENRARLAGVMSVFIMILGALMSSLITENIRASSFALACWRGLGLVPFLFVNVYEQYTESKVEVSFKSILKERSFVLYIIPWIMFSLVNYLSMPVNIDVHGEDFVYLSTIIENVLVGIFAIIGGFFADIIGRKRIVITGFIMLGLGHAILGTYPQNLFCWYFYTVVDGIAWGMFYVVFFFTLWGDLAYGKPSEKYYALGSLPFLLSNFLRLTVGSFIAETISAYAIFSFASFFLFLAVLPLMFAPETLPEKKIRERELRQYIQKAKKIKEKHA